MSLSFVCTFDVTLAELHSAGCTKFIRAKDSTFRIAVPPLFRYFSKRNALAFVKEGEVLFRALSYFRDYEDEGVRADAHEGTLVHRPLDGLRVTMVGTRDTVTLPHRAEFTAMEDKILVYCMSTAFSSSIAERFKSEVAVEVLAPLKFLARLRQSLALRKRLRAEQLVHQEVCYYDWHQPPIVDWALPERIAMRKPKIFEWQKEYRFAVPIRDAFRVGNVSAKLVLPDAKRPQPAESHPQLHLKLGDLSKICRIHIL
ncbi:MAG TPA: hypothetical protein VK642_15725 [Burkholderiales bacterium]|nr:hypothetical protein [Burkholderiales bacterium]